MKKNFYTIRQLHSFVKNKFNKKIFDWAETGSEDNFTRNKNIADLNKIIIIPKLLAKVRKINIKKTFLKINLQSPIVVAPMGHQTQFHKEGEIETCKGSKNKKILNFFTTQGRMSLGDIRKNNPQSILGWAIFPFGNKKWIKSQIKEAEKNKCKVICLCLDANTRSHRYDDLENQYDARKIGKRTNPLSPDTNYALNYDWSLIKWIKKNSKLPIICKGILTSADYKLAVKNGADAVWISNHGGRMLNSGISTVETLLEIKKNKGKKVKIIVDGGIRKGSDIIKYLCLGADLVALGRPVIYGLMYDGKKGVEKVIEILESELKTSMANGGFKNLESFKFSRIKLT